MTVMNTGACTNCANPVPPHRVCPKCGYYKGRAVLQIKVKEKKNPRS